jgi:hypothetical protein
MMCRVMRAFGLVVAIRSDAPDLFEHLESQLPAFPEDGSRPEADVHYDVKVRSRGGLAVLRGRRTVATVPDVPAASMHLVTDLQTTIAGRAPGFTFVHAGVVGLGGAALLLPARSFAGKSTLVAALVRAGAGYGSDEFAVIDTEGHVHAYSRQLALRTPHATRRVSARDLGGQTVTGGLRPGAVLFTEFRSGARLELQPLSSGEVVLRLLQHCLGVRSRPDETLAALRAVAANARGFSSLRGDADTTARLLVARARDGW